MNRLFLSLAFVVSTLAAGCGAPEIEPAEPVAATSQALTDKRTAEIERLQSDPATALCDGDCCWFRCTRNSDWKRSAKPVCGTCRDYAQYACPSLYGGTFVEYSQKWESCSWNP